MSGYTLTPRLGLKKPVVGADNDLWGGHLNENADILDGISTAVVTIAATPPAAADRALWWDSTGGQLYVGYNDGNSTAWVAASTAAGGGMAAGYLPVSGGTLTGALTGTSATFSGAVTAAGYRGAPIINSAGSLIADNSHIFMQPAARGYNTSPNSGALNYIGINDQLNYSSSSGSGVGVYNGLHVAHALGGVLLSGNRNAIHGQIFTAGTPNAGDASDRAYTGVEMRATGDRTVGGFSLVSATDGTGARGAVFGGVAAIELLNGATNWAGATGFETNLAVRSGASVANKWGIHVVLTPADAVRGRHTDIGLVFSGSISGGSPVGWRTVIGIGGETGSTTTAADSTLFAVIPRTQGGANIIQFMHGIDLRRGTITTGGSAFSSPNFSVAAAGGVYANGVTTNGIVQAQTATMTSVTIDDGGVYYLDPAVKPTYTVAPPPAGGTTATLSTATLGAASVVRFGATGKLYTVGDVLTYSGGTGTSPTFTVATVDAAGGITSVTITSVGALTSAIINPVAFTGGTGTGAKFNIVYTQSTNQYRPNIVWSGATGANYAINDVLTIVGDTGTALRFNVLTVDSFGGILTTSVNTVGSVTAVGGTLASDGRNFHTATGGAGTGASLGVGYKVLTATVVNAGAGYLPAPPPPITPTQSEHGTAYLTAVMAATAATLSLNPGGGRISAALLTNAANDAAAASAGVIVGEFYRNGSIVMQRAV